MGQTEQLSQNFWEWKTDIDIFLFGSLGDINMQSELKQLLL